MVVVQTAAGGVGTLLELKLDIQLRPCLNPRLYTQYLHRIQFWGMMVLVEAEGGFRDAHIREGPMAFAEEAAVGEGDVNIGENAKLIGLMAAVAVAVEELADFFLTGKIAYTYLCNNPFLLPLF